MIICEKTGRRIGILEWNTQSFIYEDENEAIIHCQKLNSKLIGQPALYSSMCVVKNDNKFVVVSVSEAYIHGMKINIYY